MPAAILALLVLLFAGPAFAQPASDEEVPREPADAGFPVQMKHRRGWLAMSLLAIPLHLGGATLVTWGYLFPTTKVVSGDILVPSTATYAYFTPGFLMIAAAGLMAGYGGDRFARGEPDVIFETSSLRGTSWARSRRLVAQAQAQRSIHGYRRGLIAGAVVLGSSLIMQLTALGLREASAKRGSDFVVADYALNMTSAILAFPAGVVTGVYLSRYLLARKLLGQETLQGTDDAPPLTLAPIVSANTVGFLAHGRF